MSAPQAVTERYVSNLIHNGRNREYDIISITRHTNIVQGEECGYHYAVFTMRAIPAPNDKEGNGRKAYGATVAQAVRRALEKHGVTFR